MNLAILLADWEGHMHDWGAGGWILMITMMILLWSAVIFGVIVLVRWLDRDRQHDRGQQP